MDQSPPLTTALALALQSFDSPLCGQAAEQLGHHPSTTHGVTLAFRSLQLSPPQVKILVTTIKNHAQESPNAVRSLSFSYNELGDKGALVLAEALPLNLVELGLVGCGIGDTGGAAILDWALRANHLRMICIENNPFSADLKQRFYDLSAQTPGLLLYI